MTILKTVQHNPMPEIRFYHLTRNPLEQTLPALLEISLKRGWRVLVQSGQSERLAFLDDRLWTNPADSFLPHGLAVADNADQQPVLLTGTDENLNNANVLMLVDGANTPPKRMAEFELTCLFFDGNDQNAVDAARLDWKAVVAENLPAVYWAQDNDGRWVKKAESAVT